VKLFYKGTSAAEPVGLEYVGDLRDVVTAQYAKPQRVIWFLW
jgi:hypothetical protein